MIRIAKWFLGVVLTAVLGSWLSHLVPRYLDPPASLKVEVTYSPFLLPPSLDQDLRELEGLPYHKEFDWQTSSLLRSMIPTRLSSKHSFSGIWFATIENQGHRKATATRLKIPYVTLASIQKEGVSPEVHEVDEVIEVGDIAPRENVSVTAWSRTTPTRFSAGHLRLTHNEGIGSIILKVPARAFWSDLEVVWPFLVFVLLPGAFWFFQLPFFPWSILNAPRQSARKNPRRRST